jgi:hypothetical protein
MAVPIVRRGQQSEPAEAAIADNLNCGWPRLRRGPTSGISPAFRKESGAFFMRRQQPEEIKKLLKVRMSDAPPGLGGLLPIVADVLIDIHQQKQGAGKNEEQCAKQKKTPTTT